MSELNNVFASASEEMYKAAQQAQSNGSGNGHDQGKGADQDVTDVDFEEVKDDKK